MTTFQEQLQTLGLDWAAGNLDDMIALASRKRFGPKQVLEHLVQEETRFRAERSVQRRLYRARIGRFKPMADFDWNWPTSIDRSQIEAALSLEFIPKARNLVLVANQGLGKTMIAQNVAHEAASHGHSVLFTTAAAMLLDLGAQDTARALERRLRFYSAPALLVLDEVGYLSFDNRNADLLFQVVSRRHERKSIVLTTNLAFGDWGTIFPNAACVTALIDRLVHHADISVIRGQSYRGREAEAARKSPAAKR